MEILLTSKAPASLVATDKAGTRLELTDWQEGKIKSTILPFCAKCNLCTGVTMITRKGFIYETPTNPVPSDCPANGTTIEV